MDIRTFYTQMFLIRTVENKLLELFSQGKMKGTVHTSIGQEACAVGTMNAIDQERDLVFSNHRGHGHIIAYGVPLKQFIAEVLGKVSGVNRGIGGSQHMQWKNFYSNGIQGGMVPIAVGSALAEERVKKSGAVVVVFLGDGTMGQGTVYESFNIAASCRLPVLFVLENNKYAQTTPYQLVHAGTLEDRAKPFGIESEVVDGNDVESVYARTSELIRYIRTEKKPGFIMLDTYRLGPHSKGDDVRTKEEIERHWANEPLGLLRNKIEPKVRKQIEQNMSDMVNDAVDEIIESPCLSFQEFLGSN